MANLHYRPWIFEFSTHFSLPSNFIIIHCQTVPMIIFLNSDPSALQHSHEVGDNCAPKQVDR